SANGTRADFLLESARRAAEDGAACSVALFF
ncbi:hypothetical protein A2U01_0093102, partial [Trifolium medium]|nr:hypothetical protein [Trifolium medium]